MTSRKNSNPFRDTLYNQCNSEEFGRYFSSYVDEIPALKNVYGISSHDASIYTQIKAELFRANIGQDTEKYCKISRKDLMESQCLSIDIVKRSLSKLKEIGILTRLPNYYYSLNLKLVESAMKQYIASKPKAKKRPKSTKVVKPKSSLEYGSEPSGSYDNDEAFAAFVSKKRCTSAPS